MADDVLKEWERETVEKWREIYDTGAMLGDAQADRPIQKFVSIIDRLVAEVERLTAERDDALRRWADISLRHEVAYAAGWHEACEEWMRRLMDGPLPTTLGELVAIVGSIRGRYPEVEP